MSIPTESTGPFPIKPFRFGVQLATSTCKARDRLSEIEMNIRTFFIGVTDNRAGALARIAQMISVEEGMLESSPFAPVGSSAKIAEDLVERRDRYGFSYVILGADELESFAPVVAHLQGK